MPSEARTRYSLLFLLLVTATASTQTLDLRGFLTGIQWTHVDNRGDHELYGDEYFNGKW